MKTILYLCEKPSQARQLAAVLGATVQKDGAIVGNGVVVTHAFGHIRNLAYPDEYVGVGEWKLDDLPILPENWLFTTSAKHKEQFERIGAWLTQVDEVVIATDPDEEGEVIGRNILEAFGFGKPVRRLWASALSKDSIKEALANVRPLSETDALYRAGRARHEMDWLLGMNLSRAFSVKTGRTASVGRVKSRLLREIVEREKAILSFSAQMLKRAEVDLGGFLYQMQGADMPESFPQEGVCVDVETTQIEIAPPLPYCLSGLLIAANEQFGIGLAQGYAAAQMLYEAGAISYPRTASTALPGQAGGFAAHHAIVNTAFDCPSWGGAAEQALFSLVRENGVYQDLGPALGERTVTTIDFGGYRFVNTVDRIRSQAEEAGWLLCKPATLDELMSAQPPAIKVGEKVQTTPTISEYQTEAPPRFTEATLLQKMVADGVGTEATRVSMISSLGEDGVAHVDDGAFQPTGEGRYLSEFMPEDAPARMAKFVADGVAAARAGDRNCKHHLQAVKWMASVIHG